MERHVPRRGGGNSLKSSHNQGFSLIEAFNNLAPWGEKKFISELKRTYKFQRGVNNILDCHANQTRILSKEYSFVAGDYVRSTARNDVKRHTEDNSPKYRMVGNDVGLESPTNKSFKFWYRDFCSSLRANAKQSRETVITRSDERRSNPIQNEKDEIGATHVAHWNNSRKIAFTLAEVLITLGIIGVVAAMTMPSLIQHHREKAMVTSLEKFVSTISQAVDLYKADNECVDSISTCVSYISKGDENCENFAPIAAKMNVIASVKNANKSTADWLPDKAYNYYGEEQEGIYGGVSKRNIGTCAYLLNDGTTFAVDINPTNFDIMVDVNGKKLPNRVGQDIFPLLIGADANFVNAGVTSGNSNKNKDVIFYPLGSNYNAFRGLCRYYYSGGCNPLNTDPTKDNGASPTAYVLMTKKLPPKY